MRRGSSENRGPPRPVITAGSQIGWADPPCLLCLVTEVTLLHDHRNDRACCRFGPRRARAMLRSGVAARDVDETLELPARGVNMNVRLTFRDAKVFQKGSFSTDANAPNRLHDRNHELT